MSFLHELKRRNVFKVGIAYLAGGWLLLQLLDILLPTFNAPEWVMQVIVLIIGVGFFVSLFIAWAFELTPEGIKRTEDVNPDESITPQTAHHLNKLTIITLLLVLVLIVIDAYILTDSEMPVEETATQPAQTPVETETAVLEKSIAVLPFVNQSNDPDQEYFSDGLTDELINTLSQVQDLLVVGRNSSFYFKDRNDELREIGSILNVSYILQGSVRRSVDQLRVTVQLMEANSGFNVWSQTFNRQMADVFAIQDEIARQVTTNLSVSLGVGEFDREGMTRNLAAYDAYLRGQQAFNEDADMEQGIGYLNEAVEIDPEFALAWSSLLFGHWVSAAFTAGEESADHRRQMQEAGARAAELAPRMPEVLSSDALQARNQGSWIEADRLFQDLITQYGNTSSLVNLRYGTFLYQAGKAEESLFYLQRAKRLDPVSGGVSTGLSTALIWVGRLEDGVAEANRGLTLQAAASNVFLEAAKKVAAYSERDYEKAVDLIRQYDPGTVEYTYELPLVEMLAAGDREGVINRLHELADEERPPITNVIFGPVAALAGDTDLALDFTLPVFPNGIGLWADFVRDHYNDPRAKNKFRESGLVDYWKATGWNDFCQPIEGTEDDFECE